jgi:hypothetical protein
VLKPRAGKLALKMICFCVTLVRPGIRSVESEIGISYNENEEDHVNALFMSVTSANIGCPVVS